MVDDTRNATAVHEAAHAVASYLLDAPFVEAVLFDDATGEVVPKCLFCEVERESICDDCLQHYLHNDPVNDEHAHEIQVGLWRSAAIAVAGAIGEECVNGRCEGSAAELLQDNQIARYRSCLLHLRTDPSCYRDGLWEAGRSCSRCDATLGVIRRAVRQQLSEVAHLSAVNALARDLDAQSRMSWATVVAFLESRGVVRGAAVPYLTPGVNETT